MQEVLYWPQYDILTGRAIDYQQVLMEALGRAILNLLERINFNMPASGDYNLQAITTAFIIAAALLLLAASMAITYTLLTRKSRRAKRAADYFSKAVFEDISNKRFTLSDLLRIKEEYAQNDQFRDAVRYYYIAVLVALNDKKTIEVDKSKTNDQLAQDIKDAAPALFEPFTSVIDVFQRTWFGMKGMDEERYSRFAASAEKLLEITAREESLA